MLDLTIFVGIPSDILKENHEMPKTQLFPHVSLELPCKKSHVQVVKKHFFHFHAKKPLCALLQFQNVQTRKSLVAFTKTVPWEFQMAPCQSKLRKILQIEKV